MDREVKERRESAVEAIEEGITAASRRKEFKGIFKDAVGEGARQNRRALLWAFSEDR